jgi:hypothetical protein
MLRKPGLKIAQNSECAQRLVAADSSGAIIWINHLMLAAIIRRPLTSKDAFRRR